MWYQNKVDLFMPFNNIVKQSWVLKDEQALEVTHRQPDVIPYPYLDPQKMLQYVCY